MPLSVELTERGRCNTQMRSCLSTAIPPTSPITQWFGNGCGQAGSSTNPGELPLRSTAIPSASRSSTRACCKAAAGSLAESSTPTGGAEHDAVMPARSNARTQLKIFEITGAPVTRGHIVGRHCRRIPCASLRRGLREVGLRLGLALQRRNLVRIDPDHQVADVIVDLREPMTGARRNH